MLKNIAYVYLVTTRELGFAYGIGSNCSFSERVAFVGLPSFDHISLYKCVFPSI